MSAKGVNMRERKKLERICHGGPAVQLEQTQFLNLHPDNTNDVTYFNLANETTVVMETANDGTAENHDTVLKLFKFIRDPGGSVNRVLIFENDDIAPGNRYSRITQTLTAGDYHIETSAFANVTVPSYALSVAALQACDVKDPALQKTISFGQFELHSLPCQPPSGSTIEDLFGDDIERDYFDGTTGNWVVFTWDPSTNSYANPGADGTLEPGQGFWISQRQADEQAATLDLPEASMRTRSTGAAADACSSEQPSLLTAQLPVAVVTRTSSNAVVVEKGLPIELYKSGLTAFPNIYGHLFTLRWP